ncbi:MAG: ribonuclease T2 [Pseudomonadota bacterium]
MLLVRLCALACLLAALNNAHARAPRGQAGQFDYYVLAMSWSPSYCATSHDPDQCDSGRRLGFVLHGLWPQFENGYPENCSGARLPHDAVRRYAPLFPSPKLVGHEWRRHGTCSGLDPDSYFALSDKFRNQLQIPAALRQPEAPVRLTPRQFVHAFKNANPGMADGSVLPFCAGGGRFLRELHACFAKDGRSRACSESSLRRSHNSCRDETFLIQNVR